MGSTCTNLCQKPINDTIKYLQSTSSLEWVKKLDLEKAQKIIVIGKTETEPERSQYALHCDSDYSKGIIIAGHTFYEGDINNQHLAHGKGLQRFIIQQNAVAKECYYHGYFQNNSRSGKGKYVDNKVQFEGSWKNGYPIKGIYQQKLQLLDKQKKKFKIDQINFNNPKMTTGTATIHLPDKTTYVGEFVKLPNNKYAINGVGIMYFPNSDRFDGLFQEGKYHGLGTYTWKKQEKKFEGEYKNGLKNGKGKLFLHRNKYLEGQWINGKKQGIFHMMEKQISGNFKSIGSFKYQNDEMKKE